MENQIEFKSVGELSGCSFVIPDYQRGYRWTEEEVEKLLNDLAEFIESKDDYYCLQPLVVCNGENGAWSVIDGQQRLTTIYLIIKYMIKVSSRFGLEFFEDFKLYSIDYITREKSREFLENIDTISDENLRYVDFYHMKNAYDTISAFFSNSKITDCENFVKHLISKVRFIWYDASNECSKEGYAQRLFVRLNVGKIPLTNGELVKALFLNSIYDQVSKALDIDRDSISTKEFNFVCNSISGQISYRIASEWDRIEIKLNDPSFWAFIYGQDDGYYATRIEFLFDQEKGKSRYDDKFFTFDKYAKEFKTNSNQAVKNPDNILVIKKWKEITDRFNRMQGWYEDRELYHYIGFLRFRKKDIKEIDDTFNSAISRDDFLLKLKTMVAKEDARLSLFDGVDFSANKDEIRATLLLFNVLSVLKVKDNDERLSFKDFYSQSYDIEHIKPQTPKELDTPREKRNFLESNLEYLTGERVATMKDVKKQMSTFLDKVKVFAEQKQDDLSKKCVQELIDLYSAFIKNENVDLGKLSKESMEKLGLDGKSGPDEMGNYVLLDASTNRKYKNASFIVKRFFIYNREMNDGTYILPCTKNVFNKMYSKNADEPFKWTEDDMDDYEDKIKELFIGLRRECGLLSEDVNTEIGEIS